MCICAWAVERTPGRYDRLGERNATRMRSGENPSRAGIDRFGATIGWLAIVLLPAAPNSRTKRNMADAVDGTPSAQQHIPRKRFTIVDDLLLLREVLARNPFEASSQWFDIAERLNLATKKGFTARGARERTALLVSLFKKDDKINLRKSGTEEQYLRKERILQEVVELQRDVEGRQSHSSGQGRPSSSPASTAKASGAQNHALPEFMHRNSGDSLAADTEASAESLFLQAHEMQDATADTDVGPPVETAADMGANTSCMEPRVPRPRSISSSSSDTAEEQRLTIPNPGFRPPDVEISTLGSRKRMLSRGMEYVEEKRKAEMQLRRDQLHLEQRRLRLEEDRLELERERFQLKRARFEHESALATRRLELEAEERNRQGELMKLLVDRVLNT
ncbi:uncharacterized protein LOC135392676 [Ornithodoros turicata]|uniref:uncharacterized protein LOC135392676 n=1 Tax=Ornithodoros turicata TaxID=34597 RepID=UPI0031386B25